MSKSYYRVFFSSNSQRVLEVGEPISSYYRVFFSSNSQRETAQGVGGAKCQRATIVFSFQAIHNGIGPDNKRCTNVKELLSCFLLKQFTTYLLRGCWSQRMSKSYYRVFFSSNSQQLGRLKFFVVNVKELLSCFLFKQFTTRDHVGCALA